MKRYSNYTKTLTAASLAIVLSFGLSACGSGDDGGEDGKVTLRYAWWGTPEKNRVTQEAIDAFEAENPDITIAGENSPWSGYWDKLATMTAGGDIPDIVKMEARYLQEYAGRGVLADLSTFENLDVAQIDDAVLQTGRNAEGLYGLSEGQNSLAVVANEDLFAEAGVEIPDDTTWTWDDYYEVGREISENLEGKYGTGYAAGTPNVMIWLRQAGEALYDEAGGGVGYSVENLTSFYEHLVTMRDAGGGVTPAQFTEDQGQGAESSMFATNQVAMTWAYTNEFGVNQQASGSNLRMLRAPSHTGNASDNGMFLKASEFLSVSSQTENEEAAAKFLNFMTNSEAAAEALLAHRGVPVNPEMVEVIKPKLGEAEQAAVNFINEIEQEVALPPGPSPVGASGVDEVFNRYASEVIFDRLTPKQAAEQATSEIESLIQPS